MTDQKKPAVSLNQLDILSKEITSKDKVIRAMAETLWEGCRCDLFCKSVSDVCEEQGFECPTVDEIIKRYEKEAE